MAVFQDGVSAVRDFVDFDAMAAAVPKWDLQFARLCGGEFAARIELAMTAEMQITHITTNSPMLTTGHMPLGTFGTSMILSAPEGVRSRGRALDTVITAPGQLKAGELHFLSAGRVDMVTVAFDQSLFERSMRGRLDGDAATFGSDWLLRPTPGTANCIERGQAVLALLSVVKSRAAASQAARHRLQECVMQILFDDIEVGTGSLRVAPPPVRRRVARAAEEVLRSRLDDPPSLRELCEFLAVPERTLHQAFQEAFGIAPKPYLRALRLCAAHRRLRLGKAPVTEVAADLGLFHFGRFATEYRAMFGETPSETLRRARA